jgi:hypothetical protein
MYSKITKIGLFFLFICCCISNASAQTVQKIGDTPFNLTPSAVLELESTNKGFLPPRMTALQRDGITTPAVGLTIYNTTNNALEVNTGTTLVPVWSSVNNYLPLAGGTMTGTVGVNGATLMLNSNTVTANTNTTTIGGGVGSGKITLGGLTNQTIDIGVRGEKNVTIGSEYGASTTLIGSGTGGGSIRLSAFGSGLIAIGHQNGTGTITLGSSTQPQTTNVGTGNGLSTVNIGTGTANNVVEIGGSASQVSIGGASSSSTAALEVNSTTKGFLPPRITGRDATILLPAKGLTIYNSDTDGLEVNTGTPTLPVWKSATISNPSISTQTANYTLLSTDSTVFFNTGATSLTATLPAASTALIGKIFYIRKNDDSVNTLTIVPNLVLSGVSASVVLNYAETIKVQCLDSSTWVIIDNF